MRHPVGQARLLHRRRRIATPDDGHGIQVGQHSCYREGALGKVRHLEHAQRAVPDHRLRRAQRRFECGDGLGTNVEDAPASRNHIGCHDSGVCVVVEVVGNDDVHGQHDLAACLAQKRFGLGHRTFLNQAVADFKPHGPEEGVGHPTADEQPVALDQQVLNDANLVGDLGSAQNGNVGTLGVLRRLTEERQLLLHQEAGHGGQIVRHALVGCVGAMRCAEGVVDVDFGRAGQLFREFGVVGPLLAVEAGVFQQDNLAWPHGPDGRLDRRPNAVIEFLHRLAQKLRQAHCHRVHSELRHDFPLGSPQVRAQDQCCTLVQEILQRGQCSSNAGVIGHRTVLQRHVEIHADQHALAAHVNVTDGFLRHRLFP